MPREEPPASADEDDDEDDEVQEEDEPESEPARDSSTRRDAEGASQVDASSPPESDEDDARTQSEPDETSDAGAPALPSVDGALPSLDALFGDGGLLAPKVPGPPSPDNPKECPPVAPDNPIGPCIGVPVYATCTYGTYACICDWIHWICI